MAAKKLPLELKFSPKTHPVLGFMFSLNSGSGGRAKV